MKDENKAKIREALVSLLYCDFSWVRDIASEALALLDAEDKPSVPREMVRQLVVCEMDSHPLRECWSCWEERCPPSRPALALCAA